MNREFAIRSRYLDVSIAGLSIGILLYLVSYAFLLWESPERLVLIFVPSVLALWVLRALRDGTFLPLNKAVNVAVAASVIAFLAYAAFYFYREYQALLFERAANNSAQDMVTGAILLAIVFVATWKLSGPAIPVVALVFIAYAFLGRFLPVDNVLYHAGIKIPAFLRFSVVGPDGIYGMFAVTGFELVIIFLFFAGLVQELGGLPYVISLSMKLTRKYTWGLTQIPVIASMFFGTFSGAAAANAAGTGSVTIPLMKKFGVQPHLAGAIEAVASSGGQIMPPVMGVAAFLMAEFLGKPYIQIVAMGFPPAIIFYLCTAFAVYLGTKDVLSRTKAKPAGETAGGFHVIDGLPIIIAIGVLLVFLAYFMSSVLIAGMWMLIGYILSWLIFVQARKGVSPANLLKSLRDPYKGLLTGAGQVVGILGLLCTMGVAAKMLVATGLTQKLSYLMVDLAGGQLPILLVLIFIVSILMGMAVSTAVVYIIVALLAAPALVQFGVEVHVAHFTVFYLAMLSSITPPVAIAVAVTANIAKAPYFRTGWMSCKVGFSLFLLPFVFLTKPDILAANWTSMPVAFVQLAIGFMALVYALHAHVHGLAGWGIRLAFLVLGLAAVFSTQNIIVWPCTGAIVVLGGLLFFNRRRKGAEVAAAPGA